MKLSLQQRVAMLCLFGILALFALATIVTVTSRVEQRNCASVPFDVGAWPGCVEVAR